MIKMLVLMFGGLLWQGFILQQALHFMSSELSPRRKRMTFGNAMWCVFLLGALSTVIGALGYLGIGVSVMGWLAFLAIHVAIFVGYYGLAPIWALALLPLLWLARLSFEWIVGLLPFFS